MHLPVVDICLQVVLYVACCPSLPVPEPSDPDMLHVAFLLPAADKTDLWQM